ncbi:MAG: hypothetical protein GF334_00215 [Candidatus Altiarchaeales archaeon]|nr:hypothetical protein [Candidatus Altiarchaeales archaeon]
MRDIPSSYQLRKSKIPPDEVVEAIKAFPTSSFVQKRAKLVVLLILDGFLFGHIEKLVLADIHLDLGTISSAGMRPLSKDTLAFLKEYLKVRPQKGRTQDLFVTDFGTTVGEDTLYAGVFRWLRYEVGTDYTLRDFYQYYVDQTLKRFPLLKRPALGREMGLSSHASIVNHVLTFGDPAVDRNLEDPE